MVNPMPSRRLDFKRVRADADFSTLLAAYGIELRKDGSRPDQYKALCPFHDDEQPSLKVNTEKNIYHCFACGAKGNILEFVVAMDGDDLRTAAQKVASLCGLTGATLHSGATRDKDERPAPAPPPPPAAPETPAEAAPDAPPQPNTPLTFTLKLEQTPELSAWLTARGIEPPTIEEFGLGQVSAKSKTIGGRLAIPIHNRHGQLVAYCGRYIGDTIPDDVPKYILPKGFRKDLEVFNLHRYLTNPPAQRYVVLFESYFSVMRHAAHIPALSLMGRTISPAQIELLRDAGISRIAIVFDGDEPGTAGAREITTQLAPLCWTRIIDLPDGVKPHRLNWDEFRPLLLAAWQNTSLPA